MTKKETIKYLTDMMGVIQNAYFKRGMFRPLEYDSNSGVCGELRVHECGDDNASISIDLYHFEGDGLPVCKGLNPCVLTFDDGTNATGWLFCMCYDPDEPVTPLVFEFTLDDDDYSGCPYDMDIDPEDVPEDALKNITAWLEGVFQRMPVRVNTDLMN